VWGRARGVTKTEIVRPEKAARMATVCPLPGRVGIGRIAALARIVSGANASQNLANARTPTIVALISSVRTVPV